MDNSVLDSPDPEKQTRLIQLHEELEGMELLPLLHKLMERFQLSASQVAASAGIDQSAFSKILNGENREFKAEQVDNLLEDLETLKLLSDLLEKQIWHRALRIAAYQHFEVYKAAEPRLRGLPEEQRQAFLAEYLRQQFPALAATYKNTDGQFPLMVPFLPLADSTAHHLLKRWGWVQAPNGYEITELEGDAYIMRGVEGGPFHLPEHDAKVIGWKKYRVSRKPKLAVNLKLGQAPETDTEQPNRRPARRAGRFIAPELIRIPAGEFWMGSTERDQDAWGDENPQHRVYLAEYWIARYTVTNEEYRLFLSDNPLHKEPKNWNGRNFPSNKAKHPVTNVSWNDAVAYCGWLSKLAGQKYRLPTEAEWEKAARGEFGRKYPWGDEWDATKCNSQEGGKKDTTPVGAYSPQGDTPSGIADMAGNVWEWCSSLYKPYPYNANDGREKIEDDGTRVLRGGAFGHVRWYCRSASRFRSDPNVFFQYDGFRVCASPILHAEL